MLLSVRPAMPGGLPRLKRYINFKLVPRSGGGTDKIPLDIHGNVIDAHDETKWVTAEEAWNSPFNTHGIGFLIGDGIGVVDLDKCWDDAAGAWSSLAQTMCSAFAGAYIDVTPSGQGLRILARMTLPDGHRCKFLGGEVYTLRRFVTITGNGARGSADWDAQHLAGWLVDTCKLAPEPLPPMPTGGRSPLWQGPEDDTALIALMLSTRPKIPGAWGVGDATVADIWNMDIAAFERTWGVEDRSDGRRFDHSSVDMALMSHLSYFTGREPERMQRLFEMWPGYRAWKYNRARGYHMLRILVRGCNNSHVLGEKNTAAVGQAAAVVGETLVYGVVGDYLAYLPGNSYYHRPTGQFFPTASVDNAVAMQPDGVDSGGMPKFSKPSKWLSRNQPIHQRTWFPGNGEIVEGYVMRNGEWQPHPGIRVLNTYKAPPPPTGDPNDVAVWINHLRFIYPAHVEVILDWMAFAAQYPHIKINWCLVLGGSQGIGKDFLLKPLERAVGRWNWNETSPEVIIKGQFNEYLQCRVLRINEAKDTGGESRIHFYDKTKTIITAPPDMHAVNPKGTPAYQIPNLNATIITTNYRTGGLYLSADDRRHYVTFSDIVRAAFTQDYWDASWRWMYSGGIENCAAFLMARDVSHFNAKGAPTQTPEFWEMVEGGQSDEAGDLRDIISSFNGEPFSLAQLAVVARMTFHNVELANWLTDIRNGTKIKRALNDLNVVKHANPNDKTYGRWLIAGKPTKLYKLQT